MFHNYRPPQKNWVQKKIKHLCTTRSCLFSFSTYTF